MPNKSKFTREMFDKWMTAMKSGKYKFTVGELHEDNPDWEIGSHCALGVLCHMYDQSTEDYVWLHSILGQRYTGVFRINDNHDDEYPVDEISEFLCEKFPHLKTKKK